jgi:hypothetical protein
MSQSKEAATSEIGTKRRFPAAMKFGRFRSKADVNRQTRSAASVANDPYATSAS